MIYEWNWLGFDELTEIHRINESKCSGAYEVKFPFASNQKTENQWNKS